MHGVTLGTTRVFSYVLSSQKKTYSLKLHTLKKTIHEHILVFKLWIPQYNDNANQITNTTDMEAKVLGPQARSICVPFIHQSQRMMYFSAQGCTLLLLIIATLVRRRIRTWNGIRRPRNRCRLLCMRVIIRTTPSRICRLAIVMACWWRLLRDLRRRIWSC